MGELRRRLRSAKHLLDGNPIGRRGDNHSIRFSRKGDHRAAAWRIDDDRTRRRPRERRDGVGKPVSRLLLCSFGFARQSFELLAQLALLLVSRLVAVDLPNAVPRRVVLGQHRRTSTSAGVFIDPKIRVMVTVANLARVTARSIPLASFLPLVQSDSIG